MENQHPQSQQSYYNQQYTNSIDSYYTEVQHQPLPASGYQQAPVSTTPLHQPPVNHLSEFPSLSSDSSSYAPEGQLHAVRDATSAADSNAMVQHQGNLPKSPSVHQQEVPSSYSSVTGKYAHNILSLYLKPLLQICCNGTQIHYWNLLYLVNYGFC